MTRGTGPLTALAIGLAVLTTAQTPAQAQSATICPPGTQLIAAGQDDGAGNPVPTYCAAALQQGTFDPYTGPNVFDPQGNRTDGQGQFIPLTRWNTVKIQIRVKNATLGGVPSERRPICRWCGSMQYYSSRFDSTCLTMPRNMRQSRVASHCAPTESARQS